MNHKTRMWVEAVLAGIGLVLALISLVWPTWFELLLDESPDGGNGSLERLIALVWIAGAAMFGWLARRDWRLAMAATDQT